jgi:hypothetical protein
MTVVTALSVFAFALITPNLALADSVDDLTNHNPAVTAAETQAALADTSGILSTSDQIQASTDADSAMVTSANGTTVDIPKDPEHGVTFGASNGPKLEITLPNADQARAAQAVANGIVAYDSGNGSANAVQANEDGSVRMLTVIDSPNAPTAYDYQVTVPSGGHVQVAIDGGAMALDSEGKLIATIEKPWAKDANGMTIETWFTTDGITLVQHVNHTVPGAAYPITADPRVSWSWHGMTLYLNKRETSLVAFSVGAVGAYFGWTGIGGLIAYAAGPAAQLATSRGYCLAMYKSHFYWGITTWPYRC